MKEVRSKTPRRKHHAEKMRRFLSMLPGSFLAALLVVVLAGEARPTSHPNSSRRSPIRSRPEVRVSRERLNEAMQRATGYLSRASHADGGFEYRVNLNPEVSVKPRYNLVRHAGTIFALGTYQQQYPSETTRATLNRSMGYLIDHIEPIAESPRMLAVWSRSDVTGIDAPDQAKLGGSGLALVGLRSAEEAGANPIPLEQLRGLARFILYMQKPDGGFYSKYIPSEGGRSDRWTSLYYPGEAALGLLMLYERDPQPSGCRGRRTQSDIWRARALIRKSSRPITGPCWRPHDCCGITIAANRPCHATL